MALTSQQIFEMLMEGLSWSPSQMLAFQRSQLEQLLRHARANVPFYHNRLDCVFRDDGSIDWERWVEIPVVTREDLRDRRDEMQARVLPPGHGSVSTVSTSGSSGVPITISHATLEGQVNAAAWKRFFQLHAVPEDVPWCDVRLTKDNGTLMDGDVLTYDRAQRGQNFSIINRRIPHQRKLDILAEKGISVLVETPNSIEILAHENNRRKRPTHLDFIIAVGMPCSDALRLLLSQSFGAKVLSPYSSKECGLIAYQCPKGNSFHVSEEIVMLEVLESDAASSSGNPVVITPFFNAAQPLIRYAQGDLIVPDAKCCRSELKTIKTIVGRSDPIFRFPGRDMALTGIDYSLIKSALQADFVQIIQIAALGIDVRYMGFASATPSQESEVAQHLQDLLGDDIVVNVQKTTEPTLTQGGKAQRYIRAFDVGAQ